MKIKNILHYNVDDPFEYPPNNELLDDFGHDTAELLYKLIDVCKTYDVDLKIDTLSKSIQVIHGDGRDCKYCNTTEDIFQTEKICKNCRYVVETPDNSKPNLVCSIFGTYAILDDVCDNFERRVQ